MRKRNLVIAMAAMGLSCLAFSGHADAASEDVAINKTNFPNTDFRSYVKKYDLNKNGTLETDELDQVESMNLSGKKISDITGVQFFDQLKSLNCAKTGLKKLLFTVDADGMGNTALETLDCSGNQLKTLELSGLENIMTVNCSKNALTKITFIEDGNTLVSLNCSDNQLTSLDVDNQSSLAKLNCSKNKLSSLNVTGCAIESLNCSNNALNEIDLSCSSTLATLDCSNNKIDFLDCSANSELTTIKVNGNPLTGILRCSSDANKKISITKNMAVKKVGSTYQLDLGDAMGRVVKYSSGTKNETALTWAKLSDIPATMTYDYYADDDFEGLDEEETQTYDLNKCLHVTLNLTVSGVSPLKVTKTSLSVKKGKTVKIGYTTVPVRKVTFASSNKKIATVTAKGVVKGIKKGTVKITVQAGNTKKTVTVKVK